MRRANQGDNLPADIAMAILELPPEFSAVPKSRHDLLTESARQAVYGPVGVYAQHAAEDRGGRGGNCLNVVMPEQIAKLRAAGGGREMVWAYVDEVTKSTSLLLEASGHKVRF